jgi:1-acyl-sn-glycerol-3-phosphate acyltransferase
MRAKLMGLFLLGLIRLLTGAQARWYGCPPKAEQRIYFANHQSHADLVLIWAALPQELRGMTRPIAARDYWTKTPFKQWITTAVFNAIYVSRERTADRGPAAAAGRRAGAWRLDHPVPRRHARPCRGAAAVQGRAVQPGLRFPEVVLVPAWINNVQRVMPKGEVVPVPVLCSVTFGAPVQLEPARSGAPFWTAHGRP